MVFQEAKGWSDRPVLVPCNGCIGCRLERSRQWALRCVHEAQLHESNAFITLTYSPEHLPPDLSLRPADYQKFMKRLRKEIYPRKVRYYHCGEYGSENQRPHYHACLFGYDFPDKRLVSTRRGVKLYNSDMLAKLWPYGYSTIGDVTFESAAYVARYVMKKITGKALDQVDQDNGLKPYELINQDTGDIVMRSQEYTTMSLKPGIGANWYEKYKQEVIRDDYVIHNGKRMRPPTYYDKLIQREHAERYEYLKQKRKFKGLAHQANNTPERLSVRKKVAEARLSKLKREV